MPNWCNNSLEIKGSKEDREAIKALLNKSYVWKGKTLKQTGEEDKWDLVYVEEEVRDPIFAFNNVVPEPEFKEDQDWYHWRLANWDTKWNPSEVCIGENDNTLVYTFDTAWSPPLNIYYELTKQFPNVVLIARYEEPGMDYFGIHIIKNGEDINSYAEDSMSHLSKILLDQECYCEELDESEWQNAPYFDCPIKQIHEKNQKEEVKNA